MIPLKKRITRDRSSSSSTSTSGTSVSNQQENVPHVSNTIMPCGGKLWGAKKRRTLRFTIDAKDCNENSNSTDRLTRGDNSMDGGKVDECLKGNSLDCNSVSKDCNLPSEDASVRAEYTSTTHAETSQKCVENDKGENYTPKRKSTTMDKCSDITATLVNNELIERPCCNVVENSRSSKRIRQSSNVDQPTSKSTDDKLCSGNMEDYSGRPLGNNVEAEKVRSQQKSLLLSLKPEIAKLCEILLLKDDAKSMVGRFLEYTMNNYRIPIEPLTMLQAFQLCLCSTSAVLVKQKIDIEASFILAKKHLNFDCQIFEVEQMFSYLTGLQKPSNRLTRRDSSMDGGMVDECLKRNSLDCNAVSKDCNLPSEDADVRAEYTSTTHADTSQKCVENDKGENDTPKRKRTAMDKCSDITNTLVDNELIERPRCNVVETSRSSKRIRQGSNVDQPISKSTDEKSCAGNMEDYSGKPLGNNVEAEKVRSQQKSLLLSLKPEIAKLCEIILLPDEVKSMVGKILEFIMNNYRIRIEPLTMLQAFQLSLCSTAAFLVRQKIDIEASLILAKKHLNFDCQKFEVDQINAYLMKLRKPSNRVHSNAFIIPYVESTETYVSSIINESQNRKNQWRKLLQMQLENTNKLKKYFETKEVDFSKRYKIELGAYRKYYVVTQEKLEDYKEEYFKRLAELKRQHVERLQAFETKKLEARKKFRESWRLDEVLETFDELSREEAVKLPNTVKSTDYQENATTLKSSSTDKKSDAGLDRVVSSIPCISISSSDEDSDCQIIDNVVESKSTTSDHKEVVRKSMTENTTSSPVTSVSRPVNLIEPQEQVHLKPLSSVESSAPSPVIILPCNQSSYVSMVIKPIEKKQQLPSSQDALSSKICVASTRFQNQVSEKPASNLEVGSRQSSSGNVPPFCNDPIRNQLETLRKHDEQNAKTLEQMELQLKCNFEKEMKKIQAKFQEECEKIACLKMMLVNSKSNPEFPSASRMMHLQDAGFNPMLHQLPIQENASCPSLDTISSSRGRAATTSQKSYASVVPHTMELSPALHTSYNTSEIFRDFSARLPVSAASRNLHSGGEASHLPPYGPSAFLPASYFSGVPQGMPSHPATPSRINSISSASRNLQSGVEIRTPATHLYVSSTFTPSSCVSGVPQGMTSHPATPSRNKSNSLPSGFSQGGGEICTPTHIGGVPYGLPSCPTAASNSPANSFSSLPQWLAKPISLPTTISKVGTRRRHGKDKIGLSPHTHTPSFKDMHMNPNRR